MTIAEQTLADFIAGIASTEPSPGAGAAGAVTLALAVACARKAVLMSLKHQPDDTSLQDADRRLTTIASAALAGADQDAAQFERLIAAMRTPQHDAREQADHRRAVEDASTRLLSTAERLIALGEEVAAIADGVKDGIEPMMANDLTAALALARGAAAIQRANAAENRDQLA